LTTTVGILILFSWNLTGLLNGIETNRGGITSLCFDMQLLHEAAQQGWFVLIDQDIQLRQNHAASDLWKRRGGLRLMDKNDGR